MHRENQGEAYRSQGTEGEGQICPQGACPPGIGGRYRAIAPPIPGCCPAWPAGRVWRGSGRGRCRWQCQADRTWCREPAEGQKKDGGAPRSRSKRPLNIPAHRRGRRSIQERGRRTNQQAVSRSKHGRPTAEAPLVVAVPQTVSRAGPLRRKPGTR